jgi:hypothetical protein
VVSTPPVPPNVPDDRARRSDDDPTGIRALLSSLPDPGPMPPALVDRINASIAAEQSAREGLAGERSATVVPLRRRRVGWRQLGAVAAAAAVIGVGLPALLTGTGPGDVVASLTGRGSASDSGSSAESLHDSSAGGGPASPVAPRTQSGSTDKRAAKQFGTVTLAATGTAYTPAGLSGQVGGTLTRLDAASSATAPSAGGGPATTAGGLRACLTALGVETWMPVTGDVATYDGKPAVVAVVSSDTAQSVYAVAVDCDAAHPTVLAGPVPLG